MVLQNFIKIDRTKFSKFAEFFMIVIFILAQITNSFAIDDIKDPASLDKIDTYASQISKRHKRSDNIVVWKCEIPEPGVNTVYTILNRLEMNYKPGDYVDSWSILEISCEQGYKLHPSVQKFSICLEGGRWKDRPEQAACVRTCPSIRSTLSTTVKCSFNKSDLDDCTYPINGTTALISCNVFYEEPNLLINPVRTCRDGQWDSELPNCYPTCGTKSAKGLFNIVGGKFATPGDYPWHVGIYNSEMEFICAGTIIAENIVMSAAHCFADYDGNHNPVENYLVAAGKYYREYNDSRDTIAQYAEIRELHIPERYKGIHGFQAFDIAILILNKYFRLSIGVQPACVQLNSGLKNSEFSRGIVMGWGYTQEGRQLSDELKELIIPYVPFSKCYKEIPESFRHFFTVDKICGGYLNNATSVCGGDSGGGFVVKDIIRDRYYIRGIVSTSPSTSERQCDSNQYSLYTNVDNHIDFIRNVIKLNERREPMRCQNDNCYEYFNEELSRIITYPFVLPSGTACVPQVIDAHNNTITICTVV